MALVGFATRAAKEGARLLSKAASDVREAVAKPRTAQEAYDAEFTVNAYHGTADDIQKFDKGKLGELTGASSAKEAFFFTSSPRTPASYALAAGKRKKVRANSFKEAADVTSYDTKLKDKFLNDAAKEEEVGPNIIPVKLRLKNPKIVEMNFSEYDTPGRPIMTDEIKKAKKEGYDAVIFRNYNDIIPHWDDTEVADKALDQLIVLAKTSKVAKKILRSLENSKGTKLYENGASLDDQKSVLTYWAKLKAKTRYDLENLTPSQDFTDHIAVWDPTLIRSIFAKMDPEKRNSSDIMAGIAGATVLPLATIQAMNKGKSSEQNSL